MPIAFLLFAFLTVFPGYTLAWLFNVLRFRRREMGFRLAIAVSLSIALGPLISDFIGRRISLSAVGLVYAVLSLAALPLLFAGRRRILDKTFFWLAAAWCALATLALSDLSIGRRLYFSIIGFDYAVRTAFVSSIAAFGLPARNPFFYPGHPVALRYHYFWLIQPALLHKLAPWVDARQALVAGTLWCGIGLLATVALYLRFFRIGAQSLRRSLLCASGLLLVTGLDIVPALFFLVSVRCGVLGVLPPSVEWWNDQVDGWLYSMLWEPHYIAGLIACLIGFLIVSEARRGNAISSGIVAGLAFSTAVGAALYVALVFAVFLLTWTLVVFFKRWRRELLVLSIAGATAALCSLPFLLSLRAPASGGDPLRLTVRSFFLVDLLHLSRPLTLLANLVLLPLNYFLELGLFFAIGVMEFRRLRRLDTIPRKDLALGLMALASIVVCTFLRSGVIANNDLGWRGFLIAQFVLLIRAAQFEKSRKLLILAALGLAGTLYDQALLRFFPLLSDAKLVPKIAWLSRDEHLGERTYANREAYQWLRAHSAPSALVQQNPNPVLQDSFYGLYANRNTLAEDAQCATTFGGDPQDCAPLQRLLTPLFAASAAPGLFESACAALPMDFVIAKDTDAAWGGEDTWVWRRPPLFANRFVRVFRCPARLNTPSR